MQFGLLQLFESPGTRSDERLLEDQIETLCEAERLGFDSAWVAEHHFGDYGVCASPALVLTLLAQRTRRIRLGAATVVLPFHHPVRVAEEFALLDRLSAGRIDLGIGRGIRIGEFRGYGVDPAESRSITEEALEIIETLWKEGEIAFRGRHYNLKIERFAPLPRQRPHPPIWIAAVSPSTFVEAGRRGANLLCSAYYNGTVAELAEHVEAYRKALLEAGHDPLQRRIGFVAMVYVGATCAEADSLLRDPARWQFEELAQFIPPTPPPTYEHYASLRERALWANWEDLKERAVVVCGDAPAVTDRIRELAEVIGFTDLLCWTCVGGLPGSLARRSLARLAEQVIPALGGGQRAVG